jgi:hypothetical protein
MQQKKFLIAMPENFGGLFPKLFFEEAYFFPQIWQNLKVWHCCQENWQL